MLHFDLLENPTLFLGGSKAWLKNLLIKNNIDFYEFPIEQRVNDGFDVIQFFSKSVEIWFDCQDIVYFISFNFPSNALYFNGKSLEKKEGSELFFNHLERNYRKHASRFTAIHNYTIHSFVDGDIFFAINIFPDNSIESFALYYDGYSRYQYLKGISLKEYLDSKNNLD